MTKFYWLVGLLAFNVFGTIHAGEDKSVSNQMKLFVETVNKGSNDEILKSFDIESLILLLEPQVIDHVSKNSANANVLFPSGPANILLSIQNEPSSGGWTGLDLGLESTVNVRRVRKQIQKKLNQHVTPASPLAFPKEKFAKRFEEESIAREAVHLEYSGFQMVKNIKRDDRPTFFIYSKTFERILCFEIQKEEKTSILPMDEHIVLNVRVNDSGGNKGMDQLYFYKVMGEWKLFGSAKGLVPYVPSLPDVSSSPFFRDVWVAAQKKGSLIFRLKILPENKVEVLSFGTRDLSIPFLGPAIFQNSSREGGKQ